MNPTPSPSYELAALSGKWRLVYTSNSEVMFLLAAENLPGLNVGDIITTERSVKDPLDLVVQGVPKFKVTPGAHQGNKAVKIVHAIDQPDR